MKKILTMLILTSILLMNPAVNADLNVIDAVSLEVTLVNQDPYPAEPGGYVDLLFKVENDGIQKAENVIFELMPKYPFSLEPGISAIKELGTVGSEQDGDNAFLLKYKIRVDEDAIDGENEIDINYKYGSVVATYLGTFDVEISDPKTDFEVVMQDSSVDSTTFAIANIGTNTAYSLIIRIPEQSSFKVSGPSANVVGNLDAGDYTLAGFQITSVGSLVNKTDRTGLKQKPFMTEGNFTGEIGTREDIAVDISYTDELGIRRTIQKEVELDLTAKTRSESSIKTAESDKLFDGGNGLLYIGIGAVGIIAIIVLFKLWNRKKKPKK